jgi:hypothetical protein
MPVGKRLAYDPDRGRLWVVCPRCGEWNLRKFKDLEQTHLLNISVEVPPELATYNDSKHFLKFPGIGSVMVFGHCQYEKDIADYLSTEWVIILLDEGSTFTPRMLRMLRTRLRTKNPIIRPQFVVGTNPGGEGHLWLYQRFISRQVPPEESRGYDPKDWEFISSALEDNEYLDADEYKKQFSDLSDEEYRAYRQGDWEAFAGQFHDVAPLSARHSKHPPTVASDA